MTCIDVIRIGTVTANPAMRVEGYPAISVATLLRTTRETWFPAYLAGEL